MSRSIKGLRPTDRARLASVGLRTRRLRAGLSALGIAIGVAAIVAVLGLSASSEAGLLAEIDRLGTNLLTVTNGQTLSGQTAELPTRASGMIARIQGVTQVQYTGSTRANAYRSPLIPSTQTNALSVDAASLGLLHTVGTTLAQGEYLNAASAQEPVAVLGAAAAQRLGIDRIYAGERIWVGSQWFYVVGILNPAVLAPEIDSSVLVGFPAAGRYLGFDGHPSTVYVRAQNDRVAAVDSLLAATANPQAPYQVNVSQPSAALVARADAESALNGLFLGLGAVALLVGAVGVANIMVISVLERRSEIGLRRALGATRGDIRVQFLSEAVLLAAMGRCGGGGLRGAGHDRVRPDSWLGGRGPAHRLGRRLRGGRRHRGRSRPAPRPACRPPLAHGGAADGMSRCRPSVPEALGPRSRPRGQQNRRRRLLTEVEVPRQVSQHLRIFANVRTRIWPPVRFRVQTGAVQEVVLDEPVEGVERQRLVVDRAPPRGGLITVAGTPDPGLAEHMSEALAGCSGHEAPDLPLGSMDPRPWGS
jgi:putative ABC transport system permease protein